ncbi:MAG: DUF4382 domain-containing protein [Conexivisphaera sp.]|jgi:3D (Asp-Asp-Asp) domain-containing protein
MKARNIAIIMVVVVALVGGMLLWHLTGSTTATHITTSATTTYAIALTDPPIVPPGTSALTINYSGVAVHAEEQGWMTSAGTTGGVNLLALRNLSMVIANVMVPANATINEARLYVSNATITVNGTTYPVMLPSGVLEIPVINASRAAHGALVDLQPRVIEAYVGDQPVFLMAPAAVAVPLNYTAPPGTLTYVPSNLRESLEHVSANVAVTSAILQVAGNETTLSITVKNEGSAPVEVLGVDVRGPWSLEVPPITVKASDFSATISVKGARTNMSMVFFANGTQLMPAVPFASGYMHVNWIMPPRAQEKYMGITWNGNEIGFNHEMEKWAAYMGGENTPGVVVVGPIGQSNFTVPRPITNESGAAFPGIWYPGGWLNARGFTLQPGQSATFVYQGTLALGPSFEGFRVDMTMTPIAGGSYEITALTIPASNATVTTTAAG